MRKSKIPAHTVSTGSLVLNDLEILWEEGAPSRYQVWYWPEGTVRPADVMQPTVDMGAELLYLGTQEQRFEDWPPDKVRRMLRILRNTRFETARLLTSWETEHRSFPRLLLAP